MWSSQQVIHGKPRLPDRWTIDFKDSLICVLLKGIWLVLIVNCTDVISHLALWLWFTVSCVLSAGDSGSLNWESLPQCNFLLTNDRICAASALMVKKSIHAWMFGCSFKLLFIYISNILKAVPANRECSGEVLSFFKWRYLVFSNILKKLAQKRYLVWSPTWYEE